MSGLRGLAAETGDEAAVEFAIGMGVFILLELEFQLFLDDVDGGIHIERGFFDRYILFGQVQYYLAGALLLVLGFRFLKDDLGMGALLLVAVKVAVQPPDFLFDIFIQVVVDFDVDTADFKLLEHS